MIRFILYSVLVFFSGMISAKDTDTISLAGLWRFQLDPMGFGKTPGSELYLKKLTETIILPGTTDTGGKGIKNNASHVDRLSRKFEYCGPAWYQCEIIIPEDWVDKNITLELERCHWETTVYLDGKEIGVKESLSTPNRYDLTDIVKPGLHTLTLCVDNTIKYPMDNWAHGVTEYTQTNWNGIVGDINLVSRPKHHISDLQIYPDLDNSQISLKIKLEGNRDNGSLMAELYDPAGKKIVSKKLTSCNLALIEDKIPLPSPLYLWNEFTPDLYTLQITLESPSGVDKRETKFGIRKVEQGEHHIKLNGDDIHLRGVLDCAVFPITGYPSSSVEDWTRIMKTIKNYGMNHVRFHSWCPPEAAFTAADNVGIYLQVELPMWIKDVGTSPERRDFFEQEMYSILDEYGNHPSFILYCNGNENEGDFNVLEDLIIKGRNHDSRHLYSASTARTHVKSDQFYVSHVSPKGWITAYEGKPSTDWNLNETSDIDVPVIAHETGQRCMYPNFDEIKKYTGVLEPRNFNIFKERLERNGMADQAKEFFEATGAHTVLQYKEVNESLLRTDKSGGFQLLGLQDFPGQGSAFVGILDSFWESKGLVTPEKFRESCGPVVLLARLPKRVFTNEETPDIKIGIYNFSEQDIKKGNIDWTLKNGEGKIILKGRIPHSLIKKSTVDSIGQISLHLKKLASPDKYTFHLNSQNIHNEWDIWVYPEQQVEVSYVTQFEEAQGKLAKGENVLLIPTEITGRKTKFASHFWNPVMFNWDPMIVGTLVKNHHESLNLFPSDNYADWQWYDILNNSKALDITDYAQLKPVIQSIDSYEHNRKLAIGFEAKVGNGNLFVLCVDPEKDIQNRIATKQLINSIGMYVNSESFLPQTEISFNDLKKILNNSNNITNEDSEKVVEQLLNQ